jgi:hypothetical protein
MDRLLRFHAVQLQLAALLEIPRTDPRLANRLARRAVACKKRLSFSTFPDLCPEPVLASAHFMYKLAQKRTRRFRMCTVVAHHQHARCLSDIAGYLRLLIEVRGEPLIVMISNLVAEELRRVLIQADEALLQAADGDRGGSVQVHHRLDIGASVVDSVVDNVGGYISRAGDDALWCDLVPQHAAWGDQGLVAAAR